MFMYLVYDFSILNNCDCQITAKSSALIELLVSGDRTSLLVYFHEIWGSNSSWTSLL